MLKTTLSTPHTIATSCQYATFILSEGEASKHKPSGNNAVSLPLLN